MFLQIQAAVGATWAARSTDHQAQHAVAPAAGPLLVGFCQQVVNGIHTLGIDGAQWLFAKVVAGIKKSECLGAFVFGGRCPAKMLFVVAIQGRATARVSRVEEKVLHIDRNKFFGVGDFVQIGTANNLVVILLAFATAAYILLPSGKVQQSRVITEGKASFGLTPALIGQADQASTTALSSATLDQSPLCGRPEAGAVI